MVESICDEAAVAAAEALTLRQDTARKDSGNVRRSNVITKEDGMPTLCM